MRYFASINPSGMHRTTLQNQLQCHASGSLFKCLGLTAKIIQQRHCAGGSAANILYIC
jgi:hypothetical protein